jgi:hypothetical protein
MFRKSLIALGLLLGVSTASAVPMEFTFTADGVTDSVSQQATAIFGFDTDNLGIFTITLIDTVQPTANIASELDGFQFSFSEAPSSWSLVSVSATGGVINCNGSTTPCPAGDGASPYGWGTTLDGVDAALGAGYTNGGFSYHPYAIVNALYDAPGGNGGLSNDQHNPLLVGPVTFTFNVSGLTGVPDITSVAFLFGTVPDSQDGTPTPCTNGDCGIPDTDVPEPHTLALLGLGLLAIAFTARRKRRDA